MMIKTRTWSEQNGHGYERLSTVKRFEISTEEFNELPRIEQMRFFLLSSANLSELEGPGVKANYERLCDAFDAGSSPE